MTVSDILIMLLLLLIACSFGYHVMGLFCVWEFLRKKRNDEPMRHEPLVSILKPLKGADTELEANLNSFCKQDYPGYEVLLGFTDPADEGLAQVRSIAARSPHCNLRTIITPEKIGANAKVSNLQGLVEAATYPLLAISDSDMRADPRYLRNIVREYAEQEKVGMVTCLYKVSEPETPGAALESLTIALDFMPSVLIARRLEGVTFGLGASILLSQKALHDIGGLHSLADHLADDYQLGNRLWKKGYRIVLSRVLLENVVGPMRLAEYWAHQLRWARTYRASRPLGYLGYGITQLFPFVLCLLLLQGFTALSLGLCGAALGLRLGLAGLVAAMEIRSASWLKWLVLLPAKDLASFGIWAWSFVSNKVTWRDTTYTISKEGTIAVE